MPRPRRVAGRSLPAYSQVCGRPAANPAISRRRTRRSAGGWCRVRAAQPQASGLCDW